MNNYEEVIGSLNDLKAATVSDFTLNTLQEAEDLKANATKDLYTSYRWLKTSSRVLYKLLQRV